MHTLQPAENSGNICWPIKVNLCKVHSFLNGENYCIVSWSIVNVSTCPNGHLFNHFQKPVVLSSINTPAKSIGFKNEDFTKTRKALLLLLLQFHLVK